MEEPKTVFELIQQLKSENRSDAQINVAVSHFLENKARESHTPRHGHFELTPLCNLDCKMCYVHLNKDQLQGQELLSVETWKDLMQQAIDAGMTKASLSGGECLTYPGFDELYLFLRSKGVEVNVLTNGILLNEKRIEFFKKHRPNIIQVTLYGSNNEAYERVTGHKMFDVVFKNIMAVKEAGMAIRVAITPSKYILDDVTNIIDLLVENDVKYIINSCLFKPQESTGRQNNLDSISDDEYLEIIKYHLQKHNYESHIEGDMPEFDDSASDFTEGELRCGAGRSCFAFNWKGVMQPCSQLSNISSNLSSIGFKDAWQQIVEQCSSFPRFNKCEKCSYRKYCEFCAAANEQLGSKYELSPKWCERAKRKAMLDFKENG